MRLKTPNQPPPLFYVIQEARKLTRIPYKGDATTMGALVSLVRQYYAAQGEAAPSDIVDRIEGQVCARFPDKCYPSKVPVSRTNPDRVSIGSQVRAKLRSLNDVVTGTKALFQNLTGQTEDQTIINARARVCSSGAGGKPCPMLAMTEEERKALASCQSCGGRKRLAKVAKDIQEAVSELAPKGDYILPPSMNSASCNVCGCFMAVLLPVKGEVLSEKHDTLEQDSARPDFCWARAFIKPPSLEANE